MNPILLLERSQALLRAIPMVHEESYRMGLGIEGRVFALRQAIEEAAQLEADIEAALRPTNQLTGGES